ncbi:MAG TPA: ion transporter, partial [Tenuifilaceae bacterium]|nr:ion transporter [Tenuifilaceae bacterium]
MQKNEKPEWKKRLYEIIFKADTFYGRLFDEILLLVIVISIAVVMLESVAEIREKHFLILWSLEWLLTILFLAEYILRIVCSPNKKKYIFSFFGIIDLLSILPTFIALIFPAIQPLIILRAIRLLRVYRVLKLYRFIQEGNYLLIALRSSSRKILIFMLFILILVLLLGSIMYVVEGSENGFNSI